MAAEMTCSICSSPVSEPIQELFALPSITSDCRPWSAGRSVEICKGCGVMHRVTKPEADFASIYDGYENYPEPQGRTKKILEFVKDRMSTPARILDIGAGNGSGMRIMSEFFPDALVFGFEPGINPQRPDDKFDLITLFHVLEHVEDLHEILSYIKSSLADNGHVLIQVPYVTMWPFDLILADHWWHFTMLSLYSLLQKSGFFIPYIDNNVIKKELTVLAKIGDPNFADIKIASLKEDKGRFELVNCKNSIDWILNFKKIIDGINEKVAVFGTGPAAAWTGSILGDRVAYYIDNVPFNGKDVIPPLTSLPVVGPFPDWQLPAIKQNNPMLRFL